MRVIYLFFILFISSFSLASQDFLDLKLNIPHYVKNETVRGWFSDKGEYFVKEVSRKINRTRGTGDEFDINLYSSRDGRLIFSNRYTKSILFQAGVYEATQRVFLVMSHGRIINRYRETDLPYKVVVLDAKTGKTLFSKVYDGDFRFNYDSISDKVAIRGFENTFKGRNHNGIEVIDLKTNSVRFYKRTGNLEVPKLLRDSRVRVRTVNSGRELFENLDYPERSFIFSSRNSLRFGERYSDDLIFSKDARFLIVVNMLGEIKVVLDLKEKRIIFDRDDENSLYYQEISLERGMIITKGFFDSNLKSIDLKTGEISVLFSPSRESATRLRQKGDGFIYLAQDNKSLVFESHENKILFEKDFPECRLSLSLTGKQLSCLADQTIKVWEIK